MQTPGIGSFIQLQPVDRLPSQPIRTRDLVPVCFGFAKQTLQERRQIRLDTRDGWSLTCGRPALLLAL
jgi:hypothetical protein